MVLIRLVLHTNSERRRTAWSKAIADASSYKTLDFVRYAAAALVVVTPAYVATVVYLLFL